MTRDSRGTGAIWRALDPGQSTKLVDARLQLHHAAQLATAIGISYLLHEPDDSHTNLEWIDEASALASRPVMGSSLIRLAVRFHPFALLLLDENDEPSATMALDGRTISDASQWVRAQLAGCGLDADAYTLRKHYTIPPHPVGASAAFDATDTAAFENLARFYADAALVLGEIVVDTPSASPVRCWPHHFDIATLIEVAPASTGTPQRTISLGMTPGDTYYPEPYFYASMYPSPRADAARPELEGNGAWHTHEWLGAVLPGSRLAAPTQQTQVEAFMSSAVAACTGLLLETGR
jgi:hypothetical protein